MRVTVVQAGGHGGEAAHVLLAVQGVEDEVAVQLLEEGEVGSRRVRSRVDVAGAHLRLIVLHPARQAVLEVVHTDGVRLHGLGQAVDALLQAGLHQGELLDFLAIVRAFHGVGRGKAVVGRAHGDGLRRVDRQVNHFVLHPQAVELG